MSTSNLIRWGGLAVLLGGVFWVIQKIGWYLLMRDHDMFLYPDMIDYNPSQSPFVGWLPPAEVTLLWIMGFIATLLILIGLPALYARQAKQAGSLGLIAFLVVFIGMALVTGNVYYGTLIQPYVINNIDEIIGLDPGSMFAGIILFPFWLGWLLFGVASLRARVLPRWAVALVMAGPVIEFLSHPGVTDQSWLGLLGTGVTGVGIAALGFTLWREKGEVPAEPVMAV